MNNPTGIIRRVDELGRVVIPREIRKQLGFHDGDPLEIYMDKKEGTVTFQKYAPIDSYSNLLGVLKDFIDDDNSNFFRNNLSKTEQQAIYSLMRKLRNQIDGDD